MARIYDKGVFGCGGMPRISRIDPDLAPNVAPTRHLSLLARYSKTTACGRHVFGSFQIPGPMNSSQSGVTSIITKSRGNAGQKNFTVAESRNGCSRGFFGSRCTVARPMIVA